MAVQSTYSSTQAAAFEGMIADSIPNTLISRDAEAAVGFGKAVKQGTNDDQVAPATAAADAFIGITVRDQSAAADQFAVNDTVLIMTKGSIWVKAFDGVAAGAPVYMKAADGGFTDTSTSNLEIPNAVFETSGTAGDLVRVRLG